MPGPAAAAEPRRQVVGRAGPREVPPGGLGLWSNLVMSSLGMYRHVIQVDYLTLALFLGVAGAGAALLLNQAIVDNGRAMDQQGGAFFLV